MPVRRGWKRALLAGILGLGGLGFGRFGFSLPVAEATPDWVTVHAQTFTPTQSVYATTAAVTTLPVMSRCAGTLVVASSSLSGAVLSAHAPLARLQGTLYQAQQTQSQANLAQSQVQVQSTERLQRIAQAELARHLATEQMVLRATSAVAVAQAELRTAQARWASVRDCGVIEAPVAGQLLDWTASTGQRVEPGQMLGRLLPSAGVWLTAHLFDVSAVALTPGRTAEFVPEDGAPIRVRLVSVVPPETAGAGIQTNWVPVSAHPFSLGLFGHLVLTEPVQTRVMVPTRALILDQGQWWLMLHTHQGDVRRSVVPGVAQGWLTTIEHGVAAGDSVVVRGAYLAYHHAIAQAYQPPD